jgi:hypothetical protein
MTAFDNSRHRLQRGKKRVSLGFNKNHKLNSFIDYIGNNSVDN